MHLRVSWGWTPECDLQPEVSQEKREQEERTRWGYLRLAEKAIQRVSQPQQWQVKEMSQAEEGDRKEAEENTPVHPENIVGGPRKEGGPRTRPQVTAHNRCHMIQNPMPTYGHPSPYGVKSLQSGEMEWRKRRRALHCGLAAPIRFELGIRNKALNLSSKLWFPNKPGSLDCGIDSILQFIVTISTFVYEGAGEVSSPEICHPGRECIQPHWSTGQVASNKKSALSYNPIGCWPCIEAPSGQEVCEHCSGELGRVLVASSATLGRPSSAFRVSSQVPWNLSQITTLPSSVSCSAYPFQFPISWCVWHPMLTNFPTWKRRISIGAASMVRLLCSWQSYTLTEFLQHECAFGLHGF